MGLEFDEVPVSLYSDSMLDQLNPYFSNAKVPVLLHDGLEIPSMAYPGTGKHGQ